MALQVKHMLTVGLGLGVATALGYHFLSGPQYDAVSENPRQLAPLSRFELPPAASELPAVSGSPAVFGTPTIVESNPILAQPPVDNQFRSEATPLQAPALSQAATVEADSSYQELVAAAQVVAPATAEPAGFQQLNAEPEDSDNGFSLELSSPESSNEPEFVFEEQGQTLQQPDAQAPSSLELDLSFPETDYAAIESVTTEAVDQPNDQVFAGEETFTGTSAQVISSPNQDSPLAVVVDFNSEPINRLEGGNPESQDSTWKENPFIGNGPVASVAANPALSASDMTLELPESTAPEQALPGAMESAAVPHTNSVLSLNDPAHENLVAAEPVQTMPATVIPDSIQPYEQQSLTNDQLATLSTQTIPSAPQAMNPADSLKAVHHIEYGKTLSRRGASHTARQEFLAAMQLIAAANDKNSGDNRHTKALRTAMLTIKEAGDFSVASSEQQIQMNVGSVVESHRSKVLTTAQAANLSPAQAMNRYFASAQEQLDLAGGRNVVSAEVFYCMGKLHTVLSRNQKVLGPYETSKSVVYHQVALLSDNQHHRSANELGVLLARSGRLDQAKMLFERSLMSQPTVRTWQNLAEAHRRLGEVDFANRANREVQMLASGQLPASQSIIQWKPIDQFNADAPVEFNQRVAELPSPPTRSASPSGAAEKQAPPKTVVERLKRMF